MNDTSIGHTIYLYVGGIIPAEISKTNYTYNSSMKKYTDYMFRV